MILTKTNLRHRPRSLQLAARLKQCVLSAASSVTQHSLLCARLVTILMGRLPAASASSIMLLLQQELHKRRMKILRKFVYLIGTYMWVMALQTYFWKIPLCCTSASTALTWVSSTQAQRVNMRSWAKDRAKVSIFSGHSTCLTKKQTWSVIKITYMRVSKFSSRLSKSSLLT